MRENPLSHESGFGSCGDELRLSNGWLAYCRQLDTCFFEKETLVGVPCASKTLHHNVGGARAVVAHRDHQGGPWGVWFIRPLGLGYQQLYTDEFLEL